MRSEKVLLLLRMAFLRNGYWKLFSLIIAVLIYFSIRSEISHVRVITIPVDAEIDVDTAGAVVESVEPRSVQVTVRGSYSEVNQLSVANVRCVVRPKQRKGDMLDSVAVKIKPSNLLGVRGLRVAKIDPNPVIVKFDVPMSLQLPVAPPTVTGKARGRVELVFQQTNAVVKGSRRWLSPLDAETVQIGTEAVDVDGRSQSFNTSVRLIPPGGALNAVVDPSEMLVNVLILSEKKTIKIERVPVVITQPFPNGHRWRAEPEAVDVEVTGRSEVVDAITFGEIMASASGNGLPASLSVTNEVNVTLHIRQGLTVDDMRPLPTKVRLIPVLADLPAQPEAKTVY
ncbi:MAG: hypothetical protein PHU80_01885 [Kiritimatiellae bacterium]|nr:hypothetical protein [Kiritimatiellia bacterium]